MSAVGRKSKGSRTVASGSQYFEEGSDSDEGGRTYRVPAPPAKKGKAPGRKAASQNVSVTGEYDDAPVARPKKAATKKRTASGSPKKSAAKKKRAASPKRKRAVSSSPKKASDDQEKTYKKPKSVDGPRRGSLKSMIKHFYSVRVGKSALESIGDYLKKVSVILVKGSVSHANSEAKVKTVLLRHVLGSLKDNGFDPELVSAAFGKKQLDYCYRAASTGEGGARSEIRKMRTQATRGYAKISKDTVIPVYSNITEALGYDWSDHNCICLQKAPFRRMVRDLAGNTYKWSEQALTALQIAVERTVLQFIGTTVGAAVNSRRTTVLARDAAVADKTQKRAFALTHSRI